MKMVHEVYRTLNSEGGVYIVVSYGTPENRECYLRRPEFDWSVNYETVFKPYTQNTMSIDHEDKEQPAVHYIYICKRGEYEEEEEIQKKQLGKIDNTEVDEWG